MQWRASSAPRRALSFLLALSYLPLAIASPSPTPDGGAFAENGTLTDDEYLYVLRLLVEDSTKLDALASLLRSEHGSWTAHAPGMLKLKMTSNKYGTVLWTDSRTTWQNFAAFKAYLSWRSCYGPIPEAAVWPYNVCEPTCNGGAANGAPLCMGSNPYASALISTKSECEAAATALDLGDKTINNWDDRTVLMDKTRHCVFDWGSLVMRGDYKSSSQTWPSIKCSEGKKGMQCICKSAPPSPPAPPPAPPMRPGHVQTAGGYTMIESGYCGNAKKSIVLIKTTSECEAAATALDLSDKPRAYDGTSYKSSEPPGCVSYGASGLYVWSGSSTGSCSSFKLCICKDLALLTPP